MNRRKMVSISWITDQIAVSGAFLSGDIGYIKREAIAAIVDLRSEDCDDARLIKDNSIAFLHVDIDDCYAPTFSQLRQIMEFVRPLLRNNKKVLLHCQNSCGRAPLVAVAVLADSGSSIADAVRLVEDKHPLVGFTPQQEKFVYQDLAKFLEAEQQY
ncbi:MAG: dual specificity protein phosphatase family protein [Candidatus Omnitrophota bacterium]|nr:MAG: dual specificity protein phosphatase family protein [Candidatus Omnitrophota bacterium]